MESLLTILTILSDRETARGGDETLRDTCNRIMPKFSEEDYEVLHDGVIFVVAMRLMEGVPQDAAVLEVFLRGVEFGREIEQRSKEES